MTKRGKSSESIWSLRATPSRALRVLVDRDTVADSEILLDLLLRRDGIEVLNYRDDGPPADAEFTPDDFYPPTAIGWVTVGLPTQDGPFAVRSMLTATETTVSESSLLTDSLKYLPLMLENAASTDVEENDILLYAVAEEVGVDILITDRAKLLESPLASGILQVRSSAASIAVVSLYLRGTDDAPAAISPTLTEVVRPASRYYSVIAEEYVPSLTVVADRLQTTMSEAERNLVEAVQRKLGSTLARRDTVWRMALQHPSLAQLDEMSAEVDSLLLFLTSALDAMARFLDLSMSIQSHRSKVGFQREDWRAALTSAIGSGFDLTPDDVHLISAVAGLRNFTHGVGSRTLPIGVGVHKWKKTTSYAMYEYQGSTPGWSDPLDALTALRSTELASPAFDMWRLSSGPEVFITPGPMCDLLVAGTFSLIESVCHGYVHARGIEPTDAQPRGIRIRPDVRKRQIFQFMGLPGFGVTHGIA
jgi:hypothetical protein